MSRWAVLVVKRYFRDYGRPDAPNILFNQHSVCWVKHKRKRKRLGWRQSALIFYMWTLDCLVVWKKANNCNVGETHYQTHGLTLLNGQQANMLLSWAVGEIGQAIQFSWTIAQSGKSNWACGNVQSIQGLSSCYINERRHVSSTLYSQLFNFELTYVYFSLPIFTLGYHTFLFVGCLLDSHLL